MTQATPNDQVKYNKIKEKWSIEASDIAIKYEQLGKPQEAKNWREISKSLKK
jgi:hypothetical protein